MLRTGLRRVLVLGLRRVLVLRLRVEPVATELHPAVDQRHGDRQRMIHREHEHQPRNRIERSLWVAEAEHDRAGSTP